MFMNKSIQIAILSLLCFSANINIAKSALLEQVRDLTITTSKARTEDQDLDPGAMQELTKEDYTRIAFDLCVEHGAEQESMSEIEFLTLEDAQIIKIVSQFLEKFTHSEFTKPAMVKQLTQSHPTRQEATQSLEANKAIVQSLTKDENFEKLTQALQEVKHHEKAVLNLYQHKTDAQIALEEKANSKLYPFFKATKNEVTVELYNRWWQGTQATIFTTIQLWRSFANFITNNTSVNPTIDDLIKGDDIDPQKAMELMDKRDAVQASEKLKELGKDLKTEIGEKINKFSDDNGYTLKSDSDKYPTTTKTYIGWDEPSHPAYEGYLDWSEVHPDRSNNKTIHISTKDQEFTLPAKKSDFKYKLTAVYKTFAGLTRVLTPVSIRNLPHALKDSVKSLGRMFLVSTYKNLNELRTEKIPPPTLQHFTLFASKTIVGFIS